MTYPKGYKENMVWRAKILTRCKSDQTYRLKVKRFFFSDVLFAFNAFFFTYDPREKENHQQPFCTYPYQDKTILRIITKIRDGGDLPIEKSRDMGVSWMVILCFEWFWLNPEGGADFLLGSRIEDYVDKKGDMRTLMQKARYSFYKLPKWLWPEGFKSGTHDNFMKLVNPFTESTITGESNNPNFSTGGRYRGVLFDEFPKWEHTDKSAWGDAGDATPCRIPVGTPFGAGGQYYELVTDESKEKITIHWSLHPKKAKGLACLYPKHEEADDTVDSDHWIGLTSPWYEAECERRTPSEIAQNLDIDYIGAGNPVFDGKTGKRLGQLLRIRREPLRWLTLDEAGKDLVFLPTPPRENLNCLVEWDEPSEQKSYTLGVDVAEGKEDGDFSTIKVFCRETRSVVAAYAGRIDEVQLARMVGAVGRRYKRNWTGIETIGPGLATFDLCALELQVPYLFMMPRFDQASGTMNHAKGWKTTTSSRNIMIAGIKEWLLEGEGWADQRCLREMTTFVRSKSGKGEAKSGCNDDEVIALGIAIQVDLIAPPDPFVVPKTYREDGLSTDLFIPQPTPGEQPTIEERCMESLLSKRKDAQSDALFWDIGSGASNFDAVLGDY
ncbi:hypothetical protein LCGC14_0992330 [marine sediment metagenome]|uniref:Terminase large subunit gp17-like C-terminal domain-containing protein n=1 Tax=marine sediment metagenome TaxID=412755 RepID=A0A0F9NA36_9ZZZZ